MRQIRLNNVFSLTLLFFSVFLLTNVALPQEKTPSTDEKHKAEELWEKVITAKGGRENLYAIKNLVVSWKTHSPYDKKEFSNSHYEEFFLLPDKWWWWMDERPVFPLGIRQYDFSLEFGYDVFENHHYSIDRPKETQEAAKRSTEIVFDNSSFNNNIKEKFFEHQLLYLMETKSIHPKIEGIRTEKINFKKFNIIEVSFGREKIGYVLDPKTNLPNQINFRTWLEETESYYEDGFFLEDYVEVNGVKFPQVIKRGKRTDTKMIYQINVEYDKSLFGTPPRIDKGPDGWKSKK